MARRRVFPIVLAVCLATVATAVAQAAEDVLNVVPSEALGFVVVNRLAETDAKMQKTAQQMQLPAHSHLATLKTSSGIKEGLDEERSAVIVAMPAAGADAEQAILVFLPVTDFGKFIEPMQPDDPSARIVQVQSPHGPALVAKVGGYAVATAPKHRQALEQTLDSKKSANDDLAFLGPWLIQNDVAGVLTVHGVKRACAKAQEGLKAARAGIEAVGGKENPASVGLRVYEQLFAMAEEQVTAVAVGSCLDEQGTLRLTSRTRFVAGQQAAGASEEQQTPPEGLLAGLPGGPFVIALGGALPGDASEAMMRFSVDMIKNAPGVYGLNEEQAEKMMDLSRESMKGLRGMSFVVGVGKPGDPLYSNMTFALRMDDAQAYLSAYEGQIEAMNELLKDANSPILTTMEVKKIDLNGTPGLKVEMEMPTPPGMKDVPDFAGLMEKLFGPGGKIRLFLAAADEHTVVAAYTTRKSLLRCLRATKRPRTALAADEGVVHTQALLPPGARWVGYWSPQGTIDFVQQAISMFAPPEKAKFELPAFPETPPVGLAVTTSPDEVQTHLVVPAQTLQAIGPYVLEVRKLKAEPAAP